MSSFNSYRKLLKLMKLDKIKTVNQISAAPPKINMGQPKRLEKGKESNNNT